MPPLLCGSFVQLRVCTRGLTHGRSHDIDARHEAWHTVEARLRDGYVFSPAPGIACDFFLTATFLHQRQTPDQLGPGVGPVWQLHARAIGINKVTRPRDEAKRHTAMRSAGQSVLVVLESHPENAAPPRLAVRIRSWVFFFHAPFCDCKRSPSSVYK